MVRRERRRKIKKGKINCVGETVIARKFIVNRESKSCNRLSILLRKKVNVLNNGQCCGLLNKQFNF